MNIAEARKIITLYLTGNDVAHEPLARACEVARSDEQYAKSLIEELGLHEDWTSECDVFRSHVAEFSEMSREERAQEMPTLVTHVEACLVCRRTYWHVTSLWEAAVAIKGQIKTTCKRLAEHIRLTVDKAGRLEERGCGPLPLTHAFFAAVLAAPTEEAEREEWILPDEDGQYAIHLVVCGLPSGTVTVSYTLQGEHEAIPQARHIRLEVCKAGSDMPMASGPLSTFQTQPIQLRQGSWVLRLQAPSPSGNRTWEIPLDIEVKQTGAGQ
jgi:hypothetical protein